MNDKQKETKLPFLLKVGVTSLRPEEGKGQSSQGAFPDLPHCPAWLEDQWSHPGTATDPWGDHRELQGEVYSSVRKAQIFIAGWL